MEVVNDWTELGRYGKSGFRPLIIGEVWVLMIIMHRLVHVCRPRNPDL